MLAPTLMVQGTASSVGKSLLVTALCRLFHRRGIRVAPFKAQNMALNSAVTPDGLEIGRAQAVQAEAAGVLSSVEMNPILLKPEGDGRSQVVVRGKPIGSMTAVEYHVYKPTLRRVIAESLSCLRELYELVIIEGAGSPAEINLRDRDIVNMHVARAVGSPVLLVGDIDRGGVFASFVGTMELLEPEERALISAFVINKFRGDVSLLKPGLDFLTQRTGKPVLGVIPYVRKLRVADEDSVSLDEPSRRAKAAADQLDIAVIQLPRISNYDDVQPLEHETDVVVRFVERAEDVDGADLVILPGSKNTATDLAWLRTTGIGELLQARAQRGQPVLGLCGGCQMLGERIEDPHRVESAEESTAGLGLLPLWTRFGKNKVTAQVQAKVASPSFLTDGETPRDVLTAYEIHMGQVEPTQPCASAFEIIKRNGTQHRALDGAISSTGMTVGTMLHGLLENDSVRSRLLKFLRKRKDLPEPVHSVPIPTKQGEYDRLEVAVREHIDCDLLWKIAGL